MIGNDVVDLVLAQKESNWKRKGFLNKVFTPFEQELIQQAPNQEEMVWMLWSIKESVYKAYQRIKYNEGFYPTKIKVLKINSKNESIIQLFDTIFYGKTAITTDSINTITLLNEADFKNVINLKNVTYLKNNEGLPVEKHSKKLISVSHHGRFIEVIRLL